MPRDQPVGSLEFETLMQALAGVAPTRAVTSRLAAVTRRIQELKSRLQRLNPVTHTDEHLRLFGELVPLEQHARSLREQAVGG